MIRTPAAAAETYWRCRWRCCTKRPRSRRPTVASTKPVSNTNQNTHYSECTLSMWIPCIAKFKEDGVRQRNSTHLACVRLGRPCTRPGGDHAVGAAEDILGLMQHQFAVNPMSSFA